MRVILEFFFHGYGTLRALVPAQPAAEAGLDISHDQTVLFISCAEGTD